MSDSCDIKNPLLLGGSSQSKRLLPALLPDYVQVDERSLGELLNLAWQFSTSLQYYGLDNKPSGDWQSFLEHDPCMLIAGIDGKDMGQIRKSYERLKAQGDSIALKGFVSALASEFDHWYINSIPQTRFHADLDRMIVAQLRDELTKATVSVDELHPIWSAGGRNSGSAAASFSDLESACEALLRGQMQLADQSQLYLDEALYGLSSHEPHIALLITFFQLLKYAQDEANHLTQRHLDFYYKDVLKFTANALLPDTVHVLFELKGNEPKAVPAGTLIKAGNDAAGKAVVYQTEQTIVVNKATVSAIKTVYFDSDDHDRLYAAPVANSADGMGAAFDVDEPKWKTFGSNQYRVVSSLDRQITLADEIGLAIASPTLLLNEGDRSIQLELTLAEALLSELYSDAFRLLLSCEEGWLEVPSFEVSIDTRIVFTFHLSAVDPAIVPLDPTLHGDDIGMGLPTVRILLSNSEDSGYVYDVLRSVEITGCIITVTVGNTAGSAEKSGLRALSLSNDSGTLKATKPFHPFGVIPVVGSSFYIGSSEVFQKKLDALTVSLRWKGVPDSHLSDWYGRSYGNINNSSFRVLANMLVDAEWKSLGSGDLFDSNDAKAKQNISFASTGHPVLSSAAVVSLSPVETAEYRPSLKRGFLQLKLNAPSIAFGHANYSAIYTTALIAYANQPTPEHQKAIPNPPYTPEIESLTVHYTASESIDLSASALAKEGCSKLIHLYPFGQQQVVVPAGQDRLSMLPQFQSDEGTIKRDYQAELYIGISGLEPRQNLSLLFQLAEGSADPEVPAPDIFWSYLSANQWIAFKPSELVSDSTGGLLNSGVMVFDMPKQATLAHDILPDDFHWIRASVASDASGVCDMVNIHTQAVPASFLNQDNDPAFLAQATPPETLRKLVKKNAAIKSVYQPYASFGGRVNEQSEHLYTRASERLRHKDRAISIWDYEHLVLEMFPDIFKVKCINHSTWNFDHEAWSISASEFAPGFVSLIVVADLKNKNMVNRLEPRVSIGRMAEIKRFLGNKISPFAAQSLQVLNPLYEVIEVEFAVRFHTGLDWGFYESKLNEDIVSYLSPWVSGDDADIEFGGSIHKSVILNFIEERDYVDYVSNYKMHLLDDGSMDGNPKRDIEEAFPSSARSIFVSAISHRMIEMGVCT